MTNDIKSKETTNGPYGAKTTGKADNGDYWQGKQECDRTGVKLFSQTIFYDWCKACGICIAFCPKSVFGVSEIGKPVVQKPDDCIGCRFCEMHCPDFAITISERYADRRKGNRE